MSENFIRPVLPSTMSELSTIDLLMQQARIKLGQRSARPPKPPNERDLEVERSIDRCNRLTEDMLTEARAFLNEPTKQPRLLTAAVETAEKQKSAGLLLAKHTADDAQISSEEVLGRAMASLKSHQANTKAP